MVRYGVFRLGDSAQGVTAQLLAHQIGKGFQAGAGIPFQSAAAVHQHHAKAARGVASHQSMRGQVLAGAAESFSHPLGRKPGQAWIKPKIGHLTNGNLGQPGPQVIKLHGDIALDFLAVEEEVGQDCDLGHALGGGLSHSVGQAGREELEEGGKNGGATGKGSLQAACNLADPVLGGASTPGSMAEHKHALVGWL